MKLALKIVGGLLVLLLVSGFGFYGYKEATYRRDFSATPLPAITASTDPEVIARGEALVHGVAHCSACHGPVEKVDKRELGESHELQGGFAIVAGPFGTYRAANLTSDKETGIGGLSDGMLARAIRHGVDRNGQLALFMRLAVGEMSDEDLTAVVSYLRTVPPIRHEVPADEWGIIAKMIGGGFEPRNTATPKHVPEGGISVERGEYLAKGPAMCMGCHSTLDVMAGGQIVGAPFQGSASPEPDPFKADMEFVMPNLTPDPETGHITNWTEDTFVTRLQSGRVFAGSKMPWDNFAKMSEDDLRSIHRYLKTLPPTKNATGPSYREKGWKPSDS